MNLDQPLFPSNLLCGKTEPCGTSAEGGGIDERSINNGKFSYRWGCDPPIQQGKEGSEQSQKRRPPQSK